MILMKPSFGLFFIWHFHPAPGGDMTITTTYTVTSLATLNAAIAAINVGGGSSAPNTAYNILNLLNQFANQFAVSASAYTLAPDSSAAGSRTLFHLAAPV